MSEWVSTRVQTLSKATHLSPYLADTYPYRAFPCQKSTYARSLYTSWQERTAGMHASPVERLPCQYCYYRQAYCLLFLFFLAPAAATGQVF